MNDFTKMDEILSHWNLSLTIEQKEQFSAYHALLCEWNSFMNLTAITDWEEAVLKHYCDSLSIFSLDWFHEQIEREITVMDLGTGAGFPGIPLKIVFPDLKMTLADSLNKRIKFLNEVIRQLGLENVETIHGRAEELGRNDRYREKYDLCVSRAVANLSTLSEYCLPFVKVGGRFISYKTGNARKEILSAEGAVKKLGGKQKQFHDFSIPTSDYYRTLVEIEHIQHTKQT